MKRRVRFLLIMCVVAVLGMNGVNAFAQAPQTIEVGPHFGATSYLGDLNVWRHLPQWNWKQLNQFHYDLGAVVRYNYDSRWSFRLDYSYLHARAQDSITAWRPQGKLNFKTTAHDLSLMVEFNFLNYYTGKADKGFSPYIFGGVSGLLYQVQPFTRDQALDTLYFVGIGSDDNGNDVFDVNSKKGGPNKALSIPFGLGLKMSLSEHLGTTIEWRMHYTLTDYFDGVSGNYPAQHAVADDSQGVAYDFTDPTMSFPDGYQRGNARNNDWFGMINLSITWKFVIPDNSTCKLTEQ